MENGTEALRLSAGEWSLAGDRQLLDILQTIHQKIMTKCHETNSKLEQMVTDLDNASVSLQNVNNRFMALSNSQFVESRVYEDDADVCIQPVTNKQPSQPPPQQSPLPALAAGLRRLGALHEAVAVAADSDSGSDSGQGESVILRPKDMYSDRPLPYIIGSYDWRTKWHAGLINEDSDTDSDISKPDDKEQALYSDSESEAERPNNLAVPRGYAGSTTSSERSEETRQTTNIQTSNIQTLNIQTLPRSQADIAAELARRLGGGTEVPIRSEMEDDIPEAGHRKVYKPHQPSAGTVFCDEPPPLDPSSSEEDDIFAEINKNTPYTSTHKAHSRGNSLGADRVDLFDDLQGVEASGYTKPPTQPAKQHATLFDEDSAMFENKPKLPPPKHSTAEPVKPGIKKPVGAISVFGNIKGAESIGAAILKRNQRKSSSSDDESSHTIDEKEKTSKEKDIFDDLFAKSDKSRKLTIPKKNESIAVSKNVKKDVKKVDLFSDDIFDDIDDIFASNISKVPVKEVTKSVSKVKSLFDDDDDDDLFADIVVNKSNDKDFKSDNKSKGPIDSDDDLFSGKPDEAKVVTIEKVAPKPSITANVSQIDGKPKQSSKGLIDSDEELFSKKINEATISNDDETKPLKKYDKPKGIFDSDEEVITSNTTTIKSSSIKQQKTEPLFEDEPESDDIFSDKITEKAQTGSKSGDEISSSKTGETSHIESEKMYNNTLVDRQRVEDTSKSTTLHTKSDFVSESKTQFRSPSLFAEDEDDDFFKQVISKDSTTKTNTSKESANNITTQTTANLETEKAFDNLKSANVERKFDEDKISSQTNIINSPNIFGSDDDDDMGNDLFSQITKPRDHSTEQKELSSNIQSYSNVNKTEIVSKTDATSDISKVKDCNINDSFETNTQSLHDTNIILDNEHTNLDANKNVEKDTVPTTVKNTVSNEQKIGVVPDIFADLPPAFEKPKEPKRSKNINALFDDDSDDEALFLRKEDNISDEKPTDVTNSNKEPMFALFHDEPPSIDIDFETKNNLTVKHPKSTETITQSNENVQKKHESPKQETPDNIDGVAQSKKEEMKPIGKLKPMNFNINVNTLLPGASPKKTVKSKTAESPPESQEVKSKLVKSASFEKDPDLPVLNTKISKERAKIQVKRRPSSRRARIEAVRKSTIDIGDDVDGNEKLNDDANDNTISTSPHLDNIETESKDSESKVEEITKDDLNKANEFPMPPQEVKTQVLAINDDDVYIFRDPYIQARTANDAQVSDNKTIIEKEVAIKTLGQVYEESKVEPKSKQLNIVDDDSDDDLFKITTKITKVNTQPVVSSNRQTNIFGDDDDDDNGGSGEMFQSNKPTHKQVDEVGDKATIYSKAGIFDDSDDEDMFKSKPDATNKSKANDSKSPKDTQPIISSKAEVISTVDDEEIFKTMKVNSKQSDQTKLVNSTLRDGNISKNKEEPFKNVASSSMEDMDKDPKVKHCSVIKKTVKNTIFGDLSDDELFGGKKKALDSDEELFSSKSKSGQKADVTKTTEVKKVEVKKSLFDDDDDDLFGVKPKSAAPATKPSKPAKKPTKTTETVFDDPLSMLNDDEDI